MSLIGPVTDYLFTLAQAAVVGVTVDNRPAVAVDGPVDFLEPGMFVVGQNSRPTEGEASTTATYELLTVGGGRYDAHVTVPCYIDVEVSGRDAKPARDAAEAMWESFFAALRADLSLGGLVPGPAPSLSGVAWTPTLVGTKADPGRRMHVVFDVNVQTLV